MTREEVISGLQMTMDLFLFDPATGEILTPDMLNDTDRVTYDACKGAIEALKAQIDGDTISRQAAIGVIKRLMGDYELSRTVQTGLHILPSAQPEPNYDEWCTDCKEYDKERHCCPRWNRVIRETLKDAQPEIIRCKDCIHIHDNDCPIDWGKTDYDFCSYAERRTDEQGD